MAKSRKSDAHHEETAAQVTNFFLLEDSIHGRRGEPPAELALELANCFLLQHDRAKLIRILKTQISNYIAGRAQTSGQRGTFGINWGEVDTLCFQALTLYLKLLDTRSTPGWVENDKQVVGYLPDLFWRMPDRDAEIREEKTNCTEYLISDPCMMRTKELLFRTMVRHWRLGSVYAPAEPNVAAAFEFICEVLQSGEGRTEHKVHPTTLKTLKEYCRNPGHGSASEYRILHSAEKTLYGEILEQHLERAELADIKPWVRDDIPDALLKLFQEIVMKSGDRKIALQLLKGEVAA